MNTQDLFPYDSTILGLNGIYTTMGDNKFYINSPCIIATNKIVTKGKEYILFTNDMNEGLKITEVILIDAYYHLGLMHVIVQDIITEKIFTLEHKIESTEDQCSWSLIDANYFFDKMNEKAIKSYCSKCDGTEKKPNAAINPESSEDDLLEFEF